MQRMYIDLLIFNLRLLHGNASNMYSGDTAILTQVLQCFLYYWSLK
jgi:hypothetical protein